MPYNFNFVLLLQKSCVLQSIYLCVIHRNLQQYLPARAANTKDVMTFAAVRHSSTGVGLSRTKVTTYTEKANMLQVASAHSMPHPSRFNQIRTLRGAGTTKRSIVARENFTKEDF